MSYIVWNDREKIVNTINMLMKKLRRLVCLRAWRDLGTETGNSRTQNMIAHVVSPLLESFAHSGRLLQPSSINVNGINYLNKQTYDIKNPQLQRMLQKLVKMSPFCP